MSKMNKEIEWTGELTEDYAKCALEYGKREEEITQRGMERLYQLQNYRGIGRKA